MLDCFPLICNLFATSQNDNDGRWLNQAQLLSKIAGSHILKIIVEQEQVIIHIFGQSQSLLTSLSQIYKKAFLLQFQTHKPGKIFFIFY